MADDSIKRRRQAALDANVDSTLVAMLLMMADRWGALGVALAAARLTDPKALVDRVLRDLIQEEISVRFSYTLTPAPPQPTESKVSEGPDPAPPVGHGCLKVTSHLGHYWTANDDITYYCSGISAVVGRCEHQGVHPPHVHGEGDVRRICSGS